MWRRPQKWRQPKKLRWPWTLGQLSIETSNRNPHVNKLDLPHSTRTKDDIWMQIQVIQSKWMGERGEGDEAKLYIHVIVIVGKMWHIMKHGVMTWYEIYHKMVIRACHSNKIS